MADLSGLFFLGGNEVAEEVWVANKKLERGPTLELSGDLGT